MSNNDTTTRTGKLAEERAERHLAKRGLAIVTRNFRCRGGEIDLVCRDGRVLVFVEVRMRRSNAFGGAGASITQTKQRRIILAAQSFLAAHGQTDADCRFDCVLIDGNANGEIEWIRDAFSAD